MKSLLYLTLLISFIVPGRLSASSAYPDIEGSWKGTLEIAGQGLRLVFHIHKSDDGYTAEMDSPDQGAKGIKITEITFIGNEIAINIPALSVIYYATYEDENDTIEGVFEQGPVSLPLKLERGEVTLNRPQEPLPPYPYRSEEVVFANGQAGIELSGTLTMPAGEGPFPAVVLVTGSGPQNRDEELMGHKPFLVIADHLTRNGIAVLRYDDRGVAGSGGDFAAATTYDFTGDALAAVGFLRGVPEIDRSNVGILGHSEGGTVAFVAAARSHEVAFIISLAGMAVDGQTLLLRQNRDILLGSGLPADEVDAYVKMLPGLYNAALTVSPEYLTGNSATMAARLLAGWDNAPTWAAGNVEPLFKSLSSAWMREFLTMDPKQYILATKCPAFAVNGDKDIQVNSALNLGAIREYASQSGNTRIETREYDGLNHLFQTSVTGRVDEYATIDETIAPLVLDDITGWILRVSGRQRQ